MKLKINQIQFDFTDDCLDPGIQNEVLNTIWEVENEEDLADAISDETGWCVLSIDYQEV